MIKQLFNPVVIAVIAVAAFGVFYWSGFPGAPSFTAQVFQDPNLSAYWSLNEGAGATASDSSTNGNTAAISGNPAWLSGSSCISGSCLNMDGVDDYLEAPNSPSLDITGNAITLSAWVKYTDTGQAHEIITKPVNATSHVSPYFSYGMHILRQSATTAKPRFWVTIGGVGKSVTSSATISPGTWYHLAGVYNGSSLTVYVNGAPQGTASQTGNITSYPNPLRLATNGGFVEKLKGSLDEVAIYNRALTQAEISTLAVAGGATPTPTPTPTSTPTPTPTPTSTPTTTPTPTFTPTPTPGTPILSISPSSLFFSAVVGGSNPTAQALSISNTGGGTMNWTVSDNQTWLSVSPTSGTNNGSVTVSANISGLAAGTYPATITVTATGAAGSPATIPVTLTVNTSGGGTTCTSVSQWGITWNFDKAYSCGQFVNGDWWVVGPATITSMTPAYDGTYNGWEVNPGSVSIWDHGFDARAGGFKSSLVPSLPYTAQPGSSIVKADSYEAAGSSCKAINNNGPCLWTAAVLTVVPSPPPNNGATVFRPPYIGQSKPYYSTNNLQTQILPSFSSGCCAGSKPGVGWVKTRFERIQIDHRPSSGGQFIRPELNLPVYPADIGKDTGDAANMLMLDDPLPAKMPGLIAYVQYGVDLYHMMKAGTVWPAGGGYGNGRKLPMLFAALMLNDQQMISDIQNAQYGIFGEDGMVYTGVNGDVLWGAVPGFWGISGTCGGYPGLEWDYWKRIASGSGPRDCRDPYQLIDGSDTPSAGYQLCCSSKEWKATAVALYLFPQLRQLWNYEDFITYTKRWVDFGAWTQPDPCAPWDGSTWPNNYGVTYGTDGNGGCILDTNPSDGIGRFPSVHNTKADSGSYSTQFATDMWNAYTPQSSTQTPILSVSPSSLSFSATVGGSNPTSQTLNISNTGGGTMNWTVSDNQIWLSVSPTSGTNNGNVTVSANISGLAAATYTGTITVTATGAAGSPAIIPITLTVTSTPPVNGAIEIKRVGSDGFTTSAPGGTNGTSAWVDTSSNATTQNPAYFSSVTPNSHNSFATDVAGYTETVGTCAYPVGGTACTISTFPIIPSCDGTACVAPVTVTANTVTKVVFQYLITPPPGQGPVGHWQLDEGSGTTASDSSGNGNTGTLTNGPTWSANCVSGSCLSFDGVNDYVSIPNSSSLNITNALTLAAWVNYTDNSAAQHILSKIKQIGTHTSPYFDWSLHFLDVSGTSGRPRFWVTTGGTGKSVQSAVTVGSGWRHIAGTYDGSALTIYVDGQPQGTASASGAITNYGQPVYIGTNGSITESWKGLLDDLRVYNRALTAGEVATLANQQPPSTPVLSVSPSSLSFSATVGGSNPTAQILNIANTGGGTMAWTASDNQNWLSVSPTSGTNNGSVTVSANISGLAAGTYPAAITVTATGAAGSPATIPVTLNIISPPPAGFPTFQHVTVDSNGPDRPDTVALGDIDGDGLTDIIAASSGKNGQTPNPYLVWYKNPTWTKNIISSTGGWADDARVGDIDNDGKNDIAISAWYTNNRLEWFKNNGSATNWPVQAPFTGSKRAHDIQMADLDGDGDLDIIGRGQDTFNYNEGKIVWIWKQNTPTSWTSKQITVPGGEGVGIGDIDRDGRIDFVISGIWYEAPAGDITANTWTPHTFATSFWMNIQAEVGDIDKDGLVDIVLVPAETTSDPNQRISWFKAPAIPETGTWLERVIDSNAETDHHGVALADADLDGDLDIYTAEMNSGANPDEVKIYENVGAGSSWTKRVIDTIGSHNIRVADIDNDGDFDMMGANYNNAPGIVDLWVNQLSVAPAQIPTAPTNLTLSNIQPNRISLSWQDNSNNESGFKIERSINNNQNYQEIAQVGANSIAYNDLTVGAGQTYYYRVRAWNAAGNSGYSNEASATTPNIQVPVLSVSPLSLSFSAVAGGSNPTAQALNISNTGGGTMAWTVTDDQNWLSVSPTSGTNNGSVTVSANISGLAAGTYPATITVTATGAAGSPATIPVTLTVTSTPPSNGAIEIKRVGSDGFTTSAPGGTNGTSAWVDTSSNATTQNPAYFSSVTPNSHNSFATDVAGYTETVGTCTYPVGGTACTVSTFSIIPSCSGTACMAPVTVTSNTVTKVVFQYLQTGGGGGQTLIPGTGWTGATQQPPNVGNPGDPGYNANAIARWTTIPRQAVNGNLEVGVVAFHMNNIDRVEFAVNNGPWVPISKMTVNPLTNIAEYWAIIDSNLFSGDGVAEVRAIAYPKVGKPRVLASPMDTTSTQTGDHSLFLYVDKSNSCVQKTRWVSNSGSDSAPGTQSQPMKTIYKAAISLSNTYGTADCGAINLSPGSYNYADKIAAGGGPNPVTSNAWLTIQAAPGASTQQVVITTSTSNDALDTNLVHFKNVTVLTKIKSRSNGQREVWFEGSEFDAGGVLNSVTWASNTEWDLARYFTESYFHNAADALTTVTFVRNSRFENLGQDAMKQNPYAVNIKVNNITTPPGSGYHSDVWQLFGTSRENIILYGLHATNVDSQGIFVSEISGLYEDAAIVNVMIEHSPPGGSGRKSEWNIATNHLVFDNVTLVKDGSASGALLLRPRTDAVPGYQLVLNDFIIRNSVLEKLSYSASYPPLSDLTWATNNHYIDSTGSLAGTQYTTGPVVFVNPSGDDYHPDCIADPTVCNRAVPNVPIDALGAIRGYPTAIGALIGTNEGIPPSTPVLSVSQSSFSFFAQVGGSNPSNQTLSISNTGGGTMSWTVSDNQTWLSVSPTSGTNNGSVTVSANISGLAANTYTGTITVTATGAAGSPAAIPVTLTVASLPPGQTPIPPSGLTSVFVQSATPRVTLNWTNNDPGNTASIEIERSNTNSSSGFSQVASIAGNSVAYNDFTVSLNTNYWYQVRACNTNGCSAYSNVASVTTTSGGGGQAPTAYWNFDEGSGTTANDSSGNGNTGTLIGGPSWLTAPSCKVNGCLSFDGTNDYVSMAPQTVPAYNNSSYSVALWVNAPSGQSDKRAYSEGHATNGNPLFTLGSGQGTGSVTSKMRVFVRNDSGISLLAKDSNAAVFDGTWHHVAWVDQNGTGSLYIDGVKDTQTFNYTKQALSLNKVAAGAQVKGLPTQFLNGQIDDLQVYDRALTPSEITALAGGIQPPPPVAQLDVVPSSMSFSAILGYPDPAPQTLSISNIGGGTMSWGIISNVPWLTVSPVSGVDNGTVTASVDTAGLSVGSYSGALTVDAPGALGSPAIVTVNLAVADPPPPPPGGSGAARVSRVGADLSLNSVQSTLAWIDSLTADAQNPADFLNLSSGSHAAFSTDLPSYDEQAGVCAYAVGSTACAPVTFPSTPTCDGFSCGLPITVADDTVTSVSFQYIAVPPPSPTPPATPTPTAPPGGGSTPTPEPSTPTSAGGGGGGGGGGYTPPAPVPNQPQGVKAVATSDTQAIVYWINDGQPKSGYKLELSLDGKTFTELYGNLSDTYYYKSFAGLRPGALYYVRVRAFNAYGTSPYSAVASVATFPVKPQMSVQANVPGAPPIPKNVIAVPISDSQIIVYWVNDGQPKSGYKLEISSDGNAFTEIYGNLPPTFYYKSAADLDPETTYRIRVKSFNAQAASAPSSAVTVTTLPKGAKPLSAVKAVFTTTLIRGISNSQVSWLQECLKGDPKIYPEAIVSGFFGTLTERAVKRFQAQTGLPQVGRVGPLTRDKLNKTCAAVLVGKKISR